MQNATNDNKCAETRFSHNKTVSGEQNLLPEIEKLWIEIYKLLKEKAIAASTIRNFYLRRTTPRKKTIEAIQRWIDEEKNHSDGDDECKEIDDSDDVIKNSNSKGDNKI